MFKVPPVTPSGAVKLAKPETVITKSWVPASAKGVVNAAAVKEPPSAVAIVSAFAVPKASIELISILVPESPRPIVLAAPTAIDVAEANNGIDKDVIIPASAVSASPSLSPSDSVIVITSAVVRVAALTDSTFSRVKFSTDVSKSKVAPAVKSAATVPASSATSV